MTMKWNAFIITAKNKSLTSRLPSNSSIHCGVSLQTVFISFWLIFYNSSVR